MNRFIEIVLILNILVTSGLLTFSLFVGTYTSEFVHQGITSIFLCCILLRVTNISEKLDDLPNP